MSDRQAPVIALEPLGWIARLRDGGDDGPMPDWRAAAEIMHLDAERCVIKALRGRVRRGDLAALRKRLRGLGYRTAYAQRAPGRRLPGWARIEAGDLAGWWRWELGGSLGPLESRNQSGRANARRHKHLLCQRTVIRSDQRVV